MKLILENAPDHERWLGRAFEIATREQGIDKVPFTVMTSVRAQRDLREDEGGFTGYDPVQRSDLAVMTLADLPVLPTRDNRHFSMAQVFAHEMIHVKQYVRDGLWGDWTKGGTWWHGRFYPGRLTAFAQSPVFEGQRKEIFRKYVPWEYEAYEGMMPLFEKFAPAIKGLV